MADQLRHAIVMGVSSTGKTTIGQGMAARLGLHYIEGDSFHPPENIAKMSSGIPLDDDDRRPWLEALAAEIRAHDARGTATVAACSALKRSYRDLLRQGVASVDTDRLFFVHLHTEFQILLDRMKRRQHFMPPSLLQSQFDTLEPLQADEFGAEIDDSMTVEDVLEAAVTAFRQAGD